jgi:serine/threonine protein kinase
MGAAATALIAPGTKLGKYRVLHRIAFGGMAEIYLARASGIQGFEKYVVLKRILPQYAENGELIRMFLQEARLAAILDHANIAQVHDIGEEGGVFFFTMEYLHGEDARIIMRKLAERGERIPLQHAIHIIIDAAAGLHFAHEKKGPDGASLGIVHRDLSPSNVVVTYAGGVKVVDFGVAKIATDPELSGRQSLKGKLAYMSPEQVTQGPIDRRADVFALGITLYELTVGKRLFKGAGDVETLRAVLETHIPRPSEVVAGYPAELERIVLKALQRAPVERYQSARDMQVDLETFARDQKLEISSAALAEWMEATFGPKREIWHVVPLPSSESSEPSGPPSSEKTAATRKVAHAHVVAPGAQNRRTARRAIPAFAIAVVLVLAGGAAFGWRFRAAHEPTSPAVARSEPVLLVAENGSVAIEPNAPPPGAPSAAPAPAVEPVAPPPSGAAPVEPAEKERPNATASPSRRPRAGRAAPVSGPEALSAAVAGRSADLRRCFTDGDSHLGGGDDISLRFEVGADGAPRAVTVSPASVAATPVGACLVKVGRATRFAPQPAPITFRIPVNVQLRRSEGGR